MLLAPVPDIAAFETDTSYWLLSGIASYKVIVHTVCVSANSCVDLRRAPHLLCCHPQTPLGEPSFPR